MKPKTVVRDGAGISFTPLDSEDTPDGTPDFLDLDSDDDGCSDANEAYDNGNADGGDTGVFGEDPATVNSANGLVSGAAYDTGAVAAVTSPSTTHEITACNPDTDGDGISDSQETVDATDPLDDCDSVGGTPLGLSLIHISEPTRPY